MSKPPVDRISVDEYAERVEDFRDWCITKGYNFRGSLLVALAQFQKRYEGEGIEGDGGNRRRKRTTKSK